MPQCKNCQTNFEITDRDREFYRRIDVPEPTLCPACREQRRWSFRNERTLYRCKCDKTGKDLVSMYHPNTPLVIYDQKEWWGDGWDPLDYGQEFDFSRPFFEQFNELKKVVPHFCLYSINPVNSEFTSYALDNKNCYMGFSIVGCEDCYYSVNIDYCWDCFDCLFAQDQCELCYDSVDIKHCYNSDYSQYCSQLTDCYFCYDCRNCQNCFGCVNLRNVSHHWFNEKLSKEEYEKRLANFDLGSYQAAEEMKKKFSEFNKKFPKRFTFNIKAINSTGDYLTNVKNLKECYDCYDAEDCSYLGRCWRIKDSYDVYGAPDSELIYDTFSVGGGASNNRFSMLSYYNRNIDYCFSCFSSNDLFGCVGLRSKKFCILNKQYSEEKYRELVAKIIEHLTKTGEWGEFFPSKLSPFGYNETLASEYYPLNKEEALSQGFFWQDDMPVTTGRETVRPEDVPDNIKDIQDSILNEVLVCSQCKKNYKIIPQELKYYREKNRPLPRKCFNCRHLERLALRNSRKIWNRKCDKCGKDIKTTYAPDRSEKVYCEKCYQKEIY